MVGVIDIRSFVPTLPCMEAITSPSSELSKYAQKYRLPSAEQLTFSPRELTDRLDACGIDHMVLSGTGITNGEVADYVEQQQGRLSGIASVSPNMGLSAAVAEVGASYARGLRMVSLAPYKDGILSSDKKYYPIYAKCAELGMAVVIHTAFNFGRGLKLDCGRPLHLDDVATDFPELTIIASHGGWPWVPEMVAVAWHHDNIYIELSGQRAKYLGKDGSGWETIFNYGNGPLRSRILWSAASPYLHLETQLAELKELPFKDKALNCILQTNPYELLTKLGVEIAV